MKSGRKDVLLHPTSQVETEDIGHDTRIWAFTHVMDGVSIGANCNIGSHCFIETGVVIGNDVTIKNGNMLWQGVTLEDGVFVAPGVGFTNDLYPRSPRLRQVRDRYRSLEWLLPTRVERGASLGAGAIILPGITIGEYALIGAGGLVTSDVPPYAMMVGSPARKIGWVCECGLPLRFERGSATCNACALEYAQEGDSIRSVEP